MITPTDMKLVLVGDGAVGKTSLFLAYSQPEKFEHYKHNYVPTVLENYQMKIPVGGKEFINLNLWDTAGQEGLEEIRKLSYQGATAYMMMYSVQTIESLTNLKEVWIPETVKNKAYGDAVFVVVGTKADLQNVVPEKEAIKIMKKYKGKGHIRVSAYENYQVDDAFRMAFQAGYRHLVNKLNPGCCCF
eukprot:maker-scaffold_1-snap-gene-8.10-mRNA-1 protein AED:0.26 eAED:0.26 QI:176/1/1/1/1/1/2/64/187